MLRLPPLVTVFNGSSGDAPAAWEGPLRFSGAVFFVSFIIDK